MFKTSIIVALLLFFNACSSKNIKQKIKYHDNGYFQSIRSVDSKGVLNGQSTWFYSNGFVKQQMNFIDGEANGNAFCFYENGAIKSHRYYKKDKLDGFTTDYFNDSVGLIKAVVFFENGNVVDLRKGDSTFTIENEK